MTTEYKRQLPFITENNRPFWDAAKKHQLVLQKCQDCGTIRPYPPMGTCPNCLSGRFEWTRLKGKGTIYTFTVMHEVGDPEWRKEVPYAIVVADLDEGVRFEANTLGVDPDNLRIGLSVEVVFDDITDEVTMPKLRLV